MFIEVALLSLLLSILLSYVFFLLIPNIDENKEIKKTILYMLWFYAGSIYGHTNHEIINHKNNAVEEKLQSDVASLKQKVITMQMREHIHHMGGK